MKRSMTRVRLCEQCGLRAATVHARLRPVDWDGVGAREPVERLDICAACEAEARADGALHGAAPINRDAERVR